MGNGKSDFFLAVRLGVLWEKKDGMGIGFGAGLDMVGFISNEVDCWGG